MVRQGSEHDVDKGHLLRVIELISQAAGYKGMVGGQTVDIAYEGKEPDPAVVEYIHRHKTGSLIAAAVTSGAILAGGTEEQQRAINRYGQQVGLAFQIADDVLNVEGDSALMGKGIGSDTARGKMTYPSVFGIAESKRTQEELVDSAVDSLKGFDERADPLRGIARYIIKRKT